jgi:hypothetical protein
VGGITETWAINQHEIGDPEFKLTQAADVTVGRFFWCAGNTAAYDAVFIYAPGKIRFIQVTSGKDQSFKIYAVNGLLRNLENRGIIFTHVDFVVVRPLPDTFAPDTFAFNLKTPVGSLERWFDFTGTEWQTGANCRNQARHGKVPWS